MDIPFELMEDAHVRLEPLQAGHHDGLQASCAADPAIWQDFYSYSMLGDQFEINFERMLKGAATGTLQPYAVMQGGRCVGITTYYTMDPLHEILEIGGTYYQPDVRGGVVNPATKRLMLNRAFEGGARRVVFRVDAINKRSRAAVLKLGAVEEALLREDMVVWTGRVRSTVVFSVLARKWPVVCARLDDRLSALAA
ncbi:MAG: GNAT family N-acetyltransferase [Rhizobiales bacterium]|nr:GNAT family N-acetyltransferase [Hyphomicrobiales bacterium]